MKRKIKILIATVSMICSMAVTSLAGQWISYGGKWFYMTDDGNFAKNTWLWLDENHDNNAELYHFDASGIMSQSTSITMDDIGDHLQVNINGNGAATDYTHTYVYALSKTTTRHSAVKNVSLPTNYSVRMDYSTGKYVYSSDVDHYDFKDICVAWIDSIEDNGDDYSSDVSLIVYHEGSDPGLFADFECSVKTTARFASDCMVHPDPNSNSSISMDEFLDSGHYFNFMYVNSVDEDGYITSCTLYGVE
ncbi:hypothetical protein [Oribacterium sp. WCC10]|uniref:hypothetical protein n=1 Tax=Oribacterium sp. WCC10 TaxID=1855343 RepID=UPI0008DFD7DF|nr:hypothetical protein [Oribacterium sp. WCC10]SFG67287.1 hypothetical protein SAMN05216356_11838 [Oribacterium sp. WCC10]